LTKPNLPFGTDVAERIAATLKESGLELCHLDWKPGAKRGVLTLFIDKEGGVSLADCEKGSHLASDLLDGLTDFTADYVLEVSSPGLDRPLWTLADCQRFAGSRVTVKLQAKTEGTTRLKGVLERVDGDQLTVLDEDQRRHYTVRFGDVKAARLVPEF
jgi:ribosome maturation factor RimP